jgi:streptomycin 6-kinase
MTEPAVDLLHWIASWSVLSGIGHRASGIWHLEDGDEANTELPHSITKLALDRLRAHGATDLSAYWSR